MLLCSLDPRNHSLLLHGLLAVSFLLLSYLTSLVSLPFFALRTYLLPDHNPSSSSATAVLHHRPPHKPKSKSRSTAADPFSSTSSQLLRLSLSHSLLLHKPFFALLRLSIISSSTSFLLILTSHFHLHSPIPLLCLVLSSFYLICSLIRTSFHPSASKSRERHLSALVFPLASSLSLYIAPIVVPSPVRVVFSILCGAIACILLIPASRAARSFWIGTDQPRYGLEVVHSGPVGRWIAYAVIIAGCAASAVPWAAPADVNLRVWWIVAASAGKLIAMRINLQMYLNEAVLVWYQRLHGGKVPDLDYGRAKVFLHDHYLCLAALQFYAPPALALMLVSASGMGVDFFDVFYPGGEWAVAARELFFFLSWWIVFALTFFEMLTIGCLRRGFMFIS